MLQFLKLKTYCTFYDFIFSILICYCRIDRLLQQLIGQAVLQQQLRTIQCLFHSNSSLSAESNKPRPAYLPLQTTVGCKPRQGLDQFFHAKTNLIIFCFSGRWLALVLNCKTQHLLATCKPLKVTREFQLLWVRWEDWKVFQKGHQFSKYTLKMCNH